jgi:hypothetical protein
MSIESEVSEIAAKAVMDPALKLSELSLQLAGNGAIKLAALLWALRQEKKSVSGLATLVEIMKDGSAPKIITLQTDELSKFKELAKRYGVRFAVIRDKGDLEAVQVAFHPDAIPNVNLALEKMGYGRLKEQAEKKTENPRARNSDDTAVRKGRDGVKAKMDFFENLAKDGEIKREAIPIGRKAAQKERGGPQGKAVGKNMFYPGRIPTYEELSKLRDAAMDKAVSDPEMFGKFLTLQAINPNLSPGNIALALSQSGGRELSQLATLQKWQNAGNVVQSAERGKAIHVFIPRPYKLDGATGWNYTGGQLYDFAQTDGKAPLPQTLLKSEADLGKACKALLSFAQVNVQETSGQSHYDLESKTIHLNKDAAPEKIFRDLAHGVLAAKMQGERTQVDAPYLSGIESAGYMICKRFGVDAPPPDRAAAVKVLKNLGNGQKREAYLKDLVGVCAAVSGSIQKSLEGRTPERNAAKTPAKAPVKAQTKAATKTPVKAKAKTSAKTPTKVSAKAPVKKDVLTR